MDRGYPHNLKEKLLSEINSKEILVPETKQHGRKINFAFRDSTNFNRQVDPPIQTLI